MGVEAAVHAARAYLCHIQPGQLILKVDFQNAFNCIGRDKLLQSVLGEVLRLYHLVYTACSNPSFLFFGSHIIESAEGVQQGDSLGPLLFSLTVHHFLGSLRSEFKIFYLDDGTLGSDLHDVSEDLWQMEMAAEELGLVLNHHKSEIICVDDHKKVINALSFPSSAVC